jgi:hypothetical protein
VHQHGKCKNCGTGLKKPQGMKRALQNMRHLQSKQAHRNRMRHLEKLLTSCIKNSTLERTQDPLIIVVTNSIANFLSNNATPHASWKVPS